MMKIKTASSALSILALFAAAVATSCSSDSGIDGGNDNGGKTKTVTLTAAVSENDATTRVGMTMEEGDAVSFYWHSDDAIFVQTVNNGIYSGTKFTTETKTGETSAEFTGEVLSNYSVGSYAVYPYNADHKFTSATALTYNLPATYIYNKVESGIFSKTDGTEPTYRSTSTNMPMVGKITESSISFNHIGGLAVIRIDKMPAESGTLTVTANQQLCGDFTIDNLETTNAAIETSTSAATTANKTVTITFSGASKGKVGVFYLPLATGSYSGLKIAIGDGSTTNTVNYGDLTIVRGEVVAIPVIYNGGNCYAKDTDGNYRINGHAFVDLGSSTGILWATCNIGASKPEDCGNYYAWGEVSTKESYDYATYKYGSNLTNTSKYNSQDKLVTLETGDDAATVNWGSGCRMPTNEEFEELLNTENYTWTWTTEGTISGYTVESKAKGTSIFFPAAGYYDGTNLKDRGQQGRYWSSVIDLDSFPYYVYAHYLYFRASYSKKIDDTPRKYGYPVRPVIEQPTN